MDAPTQLYQTSQIKLFEHLAKENLGLGEYELMQRAGAVAWGYLQKRWPKAKRILVFCGKGNNGGDGYEVARLAKCQDLEVSVRHLGVMGGITPAANQSYQACEAVGVDIKPYDATESLNADVIVDALLGTGIKGFVKEDFVPIITAINTNNFPVLALDVPSGLDADTGRVCGIAVRAQATVTFIAMKAGLFTGEAFEYCGELLCGDLELPHALLAKEAAFAETLSWRNLSHHLPPRVKDANKGNFGHVLVIGGNRGMAGAVRLAGEAAARVGSGLTSLATRVEHATVISSMRPELMCHAVETADDLSVLRQRATVLVVGPGLGKDHWARELFLLAMQSTQPKIVDADGLNLLAEHPFKSANWILTPHPGEAARLLGCTTTDIQTDRFAAVTCMQRKYGGIIVLKGAGTIVCTPNDRFKICTAGNPGMASGGMGDVLSGVIGGLLAQGLSLENAAYLGVLMHSLAADIAVSKIGERGLLALDLMPELRALANPKV